MKHTFAAALAAAFLALPGSILAQTEAPHDAMGHGAMAAHSNEATMVCRPAATGEKAMAMMNGKGIVCKSIAGMMSHGKMMGPSTKGMSTAEADAAWEKWLAEMLLIQSNTGTNGGHG